MKQWDRDMNRDTELKESKRSEIDAKVIEHIFDSDAKSTKSSDVKGTKSNDDNDDSSDNNQSQSHSHSQSYELSQYRRSSAGSNNYSRNRGGRGRSKTGARSAMQEKILLQCIVSSVILAVTMAVCIIKTETTENIRQNIKETISQTNSIESVKSTFSGALSQIAAFGGEVKSVFGFDEVPDDDVKEQPSENIEQQGQGKEQEQGQGQSGAEAEEQLQEQEQGQEQYQENDTSYEIQELKGERIDEDILREINGL